MLKDLRKLYTSGFFSDLDLAIKSFPMPLKKFSI